MELTTDKCGFLPVTALEYTSVGKSRVLLAGVCPPQRQLLQNNHVKLIQALSMAGSLFTRRWTMAEGVFHW